MRWRLGLRWTLLVSLLPLLTLPWIGLRFVERMAELARDERMENQASAARALAAALHERRDLFEAAPGVEPTPPGAQPLQLEALAAISVDGRSDEWVGVPRRTLPVTLAAGAPPDTLRVRMSAARLRGNRSGLLLLVDVDDERYVPPVPAPADPQVAAPGDELLVQAGASPEELARVPAKVTEREGGWRAEVAIADVPRLLRVRVTDVDYLGTRRLEASADSGLLAPVIERADSGDDRSPVIWQNTLRALERAAGRVSVYDANGVLRAQRGDLGEPPAPDTGWPARLARMLIGAAVRMRPDPVGDLTPGDAGSALTPLARALAGAPAQLSERLGMERGMPAWHLTSAHPIWLADRIVGALVLEENTAARLAQGQAALERLTLMAALAVAASVLALLAVASITVGRVVKLRNEAEAAIDERGRVIRAIPASSIRDELGDLRSSHARVLARLREHQDYLAKLRGRLVHELRTPIMVVRSSLENLAAEADAARRQDYIDRVQAGAARLERIVASMGEASNLESMLAESELESVDLRALLAGCVEGYRGAFAPRAFEFAAAPGDAVCAAVPEAIVQALDKLVSNAVDFATPGTPIIVELAPSVGDDGRRWLRVIVRNQGPALPNVMADSLFDQMVSVRSERASDQSHLGLGLYLVRLIAEFHGGRPFAVNVRGGVQVGFTIRADGSATAKRYHA